MKNVLLAGLVVLSAVLGALLLKGDAPSLGAAPGPDMSGPYLSVSGLQTYSFSSAMRTATTTVCSFKTPAATSTLVFASASFSVGSTTASNVVLAKGANTNASTTLLGQAALAANAKGTVVASSTVSGADTAQVFAPNQYLNVSMNGGTGTFSPTGSCKAEFKVN